MGVARIVREGVVEHALFLYEQSRKTRLFPYFNLKSAGGEFRAIYQVGTCEGLPAIAGSCGVLHLTRLEDDGVVLDLYLVGRVVEPALVGNLKGA